MQDQGIFRETGEIQKGDRIAIMSQNTVSFVVAFFGALMAGGVVVPVNHKLMAPEVDYVLENSGSKLFLFDGSLSGVAEKVSAGAHKMAMDTLPRLRNSLMTSSNRGLPFSGGD